MTSELNTKNIPSELSARIMSFANLIGPAVPIGSYSIDIVIFTLYYTNQIIQTYNLFILL